MLLHRGTQLQVPVLHARADAQSARGIVVDAVETRHALEVDDEAGVQEAHAQPHHQRGAAGQELGVAGVLPHQFARFVEARRRKVFELGLHVQLPCFFFS